MLRSLNGTRSLDIRLLANTSLTLHGFCDANWVGNPNNRTSTGAFLIFLGANLISRSSTKQSTVSCSSNEAGDARASINTPNIGSSALIIEELNCGGQKALNTYENSIFRPHLGLGRQKNVVKLVQILDVEPLY